MDTVTNSTGILVDFKTGYNGLGNINLAVRKFRYDRPEAEPTEIHIHPQTVKVEQIDRAAVKRLTGLKLVPDKTIKERRIQVIGLEGV